MRCNALSMPALRFAAALLTAALVAGCAPYPKEPDVLPGWRAGAPKQAVVEFVSAVTDSRSPDYVIPADRVAVFDNDGTLWSEEPWPVQFEFIFWRIRQLAPEHPEWAGAQPFKAVLENDYGWLRDNGRQALRELSPVAQGGLPVVEYDLLVTEFLQTARHPETGLRYTDMIYRPMLELVAYLQSNAFQVYVVSGGDLDFIRAFAEQLYGVPRANVIGTRAEYRLDSDEMAVVRRAEMNSINVGGNKVVNIHVQAGRRPIFAAGNSDGDLRMLQYASLGSARSLTLLLLHDDAVREFQVDRGLARIQEAARQNGWLQVSMRDDFAVIFPSSDGAAWLSGD